ncbi:MAG TPA: acyl-CoA dehydrogenase family protein [Solirubrobacteraceae bacterium]|nr:acyl-CoA dehydrogenase family protein [Solirubrobacteraceae bacterium]
MSTQAEQAGAAVAPDPSAADLLRSAAEISTLLVDLQAATEAQGRYSEDTHKLFREAGFYRMLVPKRYGGLEVTADTCYGVVREIARGCPSTGWMLGFGVSHGITPAGHFDESVQDELYATGECIAPATVMPTGTAERLGDGSWKINGTWGYCSGAPYSTHAMLHAIPVEPGADVGDPPTPMVFLAPRSAYEVLDDWGDTLGMRGTGSNSLRFVDAVIPENYAKPGQTMMALDPLTAVGPAMHGNSMYGGSTLSFFTIDGANIALGMVKGALDEYERLLTIKNVPWPPAGPRITDADYHLWHGEAVKLIAIAEAALDRIVYEWMETAKTGDWTPQHDLRIASICFEIIYGPCWEAMQKLFRSSGSSQVRAGQRMERVWRDYSQLFSHGHSVLPNQIARDMTRAQFGAESVVSKHSASFKEDNSA